MVKNCQAAQVFLFIWEFNINLNKPLLSKDGLQRSKRKIMRRGGKSKLKKYI